MYVLRKVGETAVEKQWRCSAVTVITLHWQPHICNELDEPRTIHRSVMLCDVQVVVVTDVAFSVVKKTKCDIIICRD